MNIKVERFKSFEKDKMLGFIDLRVDDCVIIKCRLINGSNGRFLSLPSVKKDDGKYDNLCYFLSKDISAEAMEVVNEYLAKEKPANSNPDGVTKAEDIAWED